MNTTPTEHMAADPHTKRTVLNWTLALSTSIGALVIVVYAYLQVLGMAGCSPGTCGGVGPSEAVFGLIEYGVPAVAVAAIVLSFATARRPYGIAVPIFAWALILAAAVVLFMAF